MRSHDPNLTLLESVVAALVLLCHKYHGIMEGTWQAG